MASKRTRVRPAQRKPGKQRRKRKQPAVFIMDDAADPAPDFSAAVTK